MKYYPIAQFLQALQAIRDGRCSVEPIAPISISSDDFRFKRTQLPLRLSYALTIHKSQGQTLEQAVVDLGSKELTAGLTFVALSRVRHINNLAIFDFP